MVSFQLGSPKLGSPKLSGAKRALTFTSQRQATRLSSISSTRPKAPPNRRRLLLRLGKLFLLGSISLRHQRMLRNKLSTI